MAGSILQIDLIDGADHTKERRGGITTYKGTRVAVVTGLEPAGNAQEAAELLARARSVVEASYPLGHPYGPLAPFCRVVGYKSEPLESTDAARVRIFYDTPQLDGGGDSGGGGGEPLTITDSSSTMEEDSQLDPATGEPLQLVWINPNAPGRRIQKIVTFRLRRTLRTIVLSGVVRERNMDRYRDAVGTVNPSPFKGYPKGYWWFRDMRDQTFQSARFYYVTVELVSKKVTDWATYPWLRNNENGEYVRVDTNKMKALYRSEYRYGATSIQGAAGGVCKLGDLPLCKVPFQQLFGLGG
jgi:hypothetical protein